MWPPRAPSALSVTVYRAPYRPSGSIDLDRLEGFALVSETRAGSSSRRRKQAALRRRGRRHRARECHRHRSRQWRAREESGRRAVESVHSHGGRAGPACRAHPHQPQDRQDRAPRCHHSGRRRQRRQRFGRRGHEDRRRDRGTALLGFTRDVQLRERRGSGVAAHPVCAGSNRRAPDRTGDPLLSRARIRLGRGLHRDAGSGRQAHGPGRVGDARQWERCWLSAGPYPSRRRAGEPRAGNRRADRPGRRNRRDVLAARHNQRPAGDRTGQEGHAVRHGTRGDGREDGRSRRRDDACRKSQSTRSGSRRSSSGI